MDEFHSDIFVIGAGMAGLSAASHLAEAGRDIRVIDKGRGPGGRMAARRVEIAGETVSFDHGTQYFRAHDPQFASQVARWEASGDVARWDINDGSSQPAFVGVPGMNGPIKAMAQELGVSWSTQAKDLEHTGEGWRIKTASGDVFTANHVLAAIPAEQAAVLLEPAAPQWASIARSVTSQPCWAVMAAFDAPLSLGANTYRSEDGPIAWAARNSAKPRRSGAQCWVIHASAERTRQVLDLHKEEAAGVLLADFFAQTGTDALEPVHLDAHRWLYSQPAAIGEAPAHFDAERGIGIAGDYLVAPKVEGAWLSGRALAELVLKAG